MKYLFRGTAAVAAVTAAALLGAGCARGEARAPAVEKTDLTVGAVPVADSAALYIAQQRHLFAAEGLHVKIVPVVSGATAISGQLADKFDVVLGNYVSYILANTQHGHNFRVLAPGAAVGPSVALAGAESIADTDSGGTQDFPLGGYMVTQSWERANPGTAAAFRRALLAGQKIAAANPPAIWGGLEKFANIPASAADLIALPGYPLTMTAGTLQRIVGLMETFGMLSRGYDASQMLR
jgi:ABC-type nitrate/sulfonate/bicarbonate transport system substrate-binding protein